ncbi:hypothetical protein PHMEG_0007109 [Phytophthora megakarya]|uniref:Uncharacterized protein n=1 Tax=Phytophthora megakarya TaxID=4795 RepID=A0A225WM40_9STRA|nr:hypothetical protein PHMEG_0007109 [Phytophthora megakarya]
MEQLFFVGGTFSCVPTEYAQCVVFMYCQLWGQLQVTDQSIEPAEVVRDFELVLMNTLQTQFPNSAIPEEECHIAITRVVLDTLTAIEHEQVKRDIYETELSLFDITYSTEKWGNVWSYFERAYLVLFTVDEWNVHEFNNELIARTNNPIQRFNRELNTRFATPHPSMGTFVTAINQDALQCICTARFRRTFDCNPRPEICNVLKGTGESHLAPSPPHQ